MKRWRLLTMVSVLLVAAAAATLPMGCMPARRATPEQLAAVESHTIAVATVPGRTVAYRRAGNPDGQRVIFIHGSPGDWGAWGDYLVEPVGDFDLVAVDRLGYGQSVSGLDAKGRPSRAAVLSYAEQAGALEELLVEHHGRWPILVGHSLGGPIAARLAADHPDRVGGLLILAGSLDPRFEQPAWYSRLFATGATRWVLPGALAQSNREMMVTLSETQQLATVLDAITCPVTVVHGADDTLVPVGNVDYMRAKMTNAATPEFIIVPKQGHFLPWEQEKLVRELIEKLAEDPAAPQKK